MSFFRMEDGKLVLDKDEIRTVPEFRRILERDKGSEGDVDGRKKFRAEKEFLYIYNFIDLRSWLNKGGYGEKEKHLKALKEADLEEGFRPDNDLKSAIRKYGEIQEATLPTLTTISTLIRGLKTGDAIANSIIGNIETQLGLHNKRRDERAAQNEPTDLANDMAISIALSEQLGVLLDMGNKLPKSIETLEKLEERLKKEEAGDNLARGGKDIGSRADPKKK